MTCDETRRAIDPWIDGEAAAPEHLESCTGCRREADARRALHERLRALKLPSHPAPALRLRAPAPARRWLPMVPSLAAASLLVAALFLIRPAPTEPVPDLVARASDFHDRIVSGTIRPEELSDPAALRSYFRDRLKLDVVVPPAGRDATLCGGSCCDAAVGDGAFPCIVYRVRGVPMSLLVVDCALPPMPASARRIRNGQEYYVFRCGRNTALLCCSGSVCHLWIAAFDEATLLDAVLGTSVGRTAFSGERLTLAGVT
ncbi:MAG: hypothetical protein HYY17_14100 [Planctomycetes bacterium]|nr:hypothetical protein [Planctomycetota bacterium]